MKNFYFILIVLISMPAFAQQQAVKCGVVTELELFPKSALMLIDGSKDYIRVSDTGPISLALYSYTNKTPVCALVYLKPSADLDGFTRVVDRFDSLISLSFQR